MQSPFFSFLRYCAEPTEAVPETLREADWNAMYAFADKQALWAFTFAGLKRLLEAGANVPQPSKELKLRWFAMSEKVRRRSAEMDSLCRAVSQKFQREGFGCCVLKGRGLAQYYPEPLCRTSGDIDIWLDGDRQRIVEYVERICPGQIERYHHIDFPAVKGVEIEVHFTPSYMYNPAHNRLLQQFFAQHRARLLAKTSDNPLGFPTPDVAFNRVYILAHLYRHVFEEGIGLRQLLDYYYVLRQPMDDNERQEAAKTIKSLGMGRFAGGVMHIMAEAFGLPESQLIVPPDAREGSFLLEESVIGGNFGKHDTRQGDKTSEGFAHRYFRQTARNLRLASRYPTEALCEPIFRTAWFFRKNMLKRRMF